MHPGFLTLERNQKSARSITSEESSGQSEDIGSPPPSASLAELSACALCARDETIAVSYMAIEFASEALSSARGKRHSTDANKLSGKPFNGFRHRRTGQLIGQKASLHSESDQEKASLSPESTQNLTGVRKYTIRESFSRRDSEERIQSDEQKN